MKYSPMTIAQQRTRRRIRDLNKKLTDASVALARLRLQVAHGISAARFRCCHANDMHGLCRVCGATPQEQRVIARRRKQLGMLRK